MRSTEVVLLIGPLLFTFVAYHVSFRTHASTPISVVKRLTITRSPTSSSLSSSATPSTEPPKSGLPPAPDGDAKHPRVAVCFAGNARTFTRRYVYEGIMTHIIDTIRNAGHPVDIFVNLKSSDNPLDVGRGPTHANHTVLKSILSSVVKPVVENHLALDDNMIPEQATSVEDNSQLFNKPSFCNGTEYYGVIARPQILYRFHQCMRLIEQYEVDYNLKYPFVYMLRPDIWINASIYLPEFLGNRKNRNTLFTNMSPRGITEPFRHWYSLAFPKVDIDKTIPFSGDFLIAGTRRVIDIATKAHTSVDTCDPYQFQGHLGPEMNLLRWMLKHNFSVDSEPIPICIARGTGPECFLFETFSKLTEAKAMEMADNCRLRQQELGRQGEEMVT